MKLGLKFRHWPWSIVDDIDSESIGGVYELLNGVESSVYNDILFVWQIRDNDNVNDGDVFVFRREHPVVLGDFLYSLSSLLIGCDCEACFDDGVSSDIKVRCHVDKPEDLQDCLWKDIIHEHRDNEVGSNEQKGTPF